MELKTERSEVPLVLERRHFLQQPCQGHPASSHTHEFHTCGHYLHYLQVVTEWINGELPLHLRGASSCQG